MDTCCHNKLLGSYRFPDHCSSPPEDAYRATYRYPEMIEAYARPPSSGRFDTYSESVIFYLWRKGHIRVYLQASERI
jgi:hypothetical protein